MFDERDIFLARSRCIARVIWCILIFFFNQWLAAPTLAQFADAAPVSVINYEYLPKVGTQATQPACTVWAWCYYYKTWQDAKEMGWTSPDPAVNPERVCNPDFIWRLGDVQNVLKYLGCASFATMPSGWDLTTDLPTEACYADARLHRARDFQGFSSDAATAMNELKTHLAGGDLANVGLTTYDNFFTYAGGSGDGYDQDVYYAARGSARLSHSMTIIGYDDAKEFNVDGIPSTGAFLLVNSWGQDWGCVLPQVATRGFIWISYDYFQTSGMLASTSVMLDRPSTEDRNFVQLTVAHPLMAELVCSFVAGDPDFPSGFFNLGNLLGPRSFYGTIRIGIDELLSELAYGFRLTVFDYNFSDSLNLDGGGTGVVEDWRVIMEGVPQAWYCNGLPVATQDWQNPLDMEEWKEKSSIFKMNLLEEIDADDTIVWAGTGRFWLNSFDLDGDGDPDLLASHPYAIDRYYTDILRNNGTLNFEAIACDLPEAGRIEATGDFNRDGRLDALVANHLTNAFEVHLGGETMGMFTQAASFPSPDDSTIACAAAVDFDLDGDLDCATVSGTEAPGPSSPCHWRLWLNDGAGGFTDSGLRLNYPSRNYDRMAFGDFNADGWPDLALGTVRLHTSGEITYPAYELVILANGGTSLSLNETAAFTSWTPDYLGWADIDDDGWLDLFLSDENGLRLFHNLGGTAFEAIDHSLSGLKHVVSMAFGDVNNDGRCDLAVEAVREVDGEDKDHTAVYLNRGNGEFVWLAGPEDDLYSAAVCLTNFNRDGSLDFVTYGAFYDGVLPPVARMHCFEGRTGQANRLAVSNIPPATPQITSAGYDAEQGGILFEWPPVTDDLSGELTYRLKLGTLPGWDNIVRERLDLGRRVDWRPRAGSGAGGNHRGFLNLTPSQPVFLSVQAMDAGLALSEWSEPVEIASENGTRPFDLNGDGVVDVADPVSFIHHKLDSPAWLQGDLNGNGRLDELDLKVSVNHLLGKPSPASDAIGMMTASPKGGDYESSEFSLHFPSGIVDSDFPITILPSGEPFDGAALIPGTSLRLRGMPAERGGAVTVRMLVPEGYSAETTVLVWAQESIPASSWKRQTVWRTYRPTRSEGRWLTFEIPPPITTVEALTNSSIATEASSLPVDAGVRGGSLTPERQAYSLEKVDNCLGLATGNLAMESDHFRVEYSGTLSSTKIAAMLDALEWTYARWQNVYGMNYADYMSWPDKVQVEVRDMKLDGFYCPIMDFIAVRQQNVEAGTVPYNKALFAVTCTHEFTHMALSRYAHGIKPVGDAYKTLWPEEATTTHIESIYTNGEAPSVMSQNFVKPFQLGMLLISPGDAQNYGYGMASLIAWFDKRDASETFPKKLWDQINKNLPIAGAFTAAGGQSGWGWWTDYIEDFVTGTPYAFNYSDANSATQGANRFDFTTLSANDRTWRRAKTFRVPRLPELGACMFKLTPDAVNMTENQTLSLRLTQVNANYPVKLDLALFKEHLSDITKQGRGVAANGGYKFDLPLSGMLGSLTNILAVVTTPDSHLGSYDPHGPGASGYYTSYHPGYADILLIAGVTDEQTWTPPSSNFAENGGIIGFNPSFSVDYSVSGRGLANVMMEDETSSGIGYYMVAYSLGVPPIDYSASISATYIKNVSYDSINRKVYTAEPVKTYRMKYRLNRPDDPLASSDSVSGTFTLPLSLTSTYIYGSFYAVYDVTEETYDEANNLISTVTHANCETLLSRLSILP